MPCVDSAAPRLSWALASARRDERQTAYRIVAGEDEDDVRAGRGTLWDTGRVESPDCVDIAYAGRRLPPAAEIAWAVQVWDRDGATSDWSAPARFRTGLASWTADWIRADPDFEPAVEPPTEAGLTDSEALRPTRARTCAGGSRRGPDPARDAVRHRARRSSSCTLNGARVGDAVLAPGWTDYRTRIEYQRYDVTDLLREGENVLGAILGDGWYAGYVGFDAKRGRRALRDAARAAVRAARRARGRHARDRRLPTRLARHDRPDPSTPTC